MTAHFTEFEPVAPMPEASLRLIAERTDDAFAELLERTGTGFIGDGFFRVIDPAALAPLSQTCLSPLDEGAVPVMTTAFGDVLYGRGRHLRIYRYRHGLRDNVGIIHPEFLVRDVDDPDVRARVAPDGGHAEAVRRLGRPSLDECFGYVPILALGGAEKSENLKVQPLVPHVELIVSAAGIPLLTRD